MLILPADSQNRHEYRMHVYLEDSSTVGLYNIAVSICPGSTSDDDSRGTDDSD